MKNRTVIGVICMVVAVAITFLIAPLVNRLSTDSTEVIRLAQDVKQGVQITADHLEVAKVKTDSIPDGTLNDPKEIIGKYASSMLYAGDYLTAAKLTGEANTASDAFASLDGKKVAVSVTIDTFAAGLGFGGSFAATPSHRLSVCVAKAYSPRESCITGFWNCSKSFPYPQTCPHV